MDKKFREGFAQLGKRKMTFEGWCYMKQIGELADLARSYPDTTIILNHFGGPLGQGSYAGKQKEVEVDDAGDSGIFLRGSAKSQINIWCWPAGSGEVYGYRTDKSQPPEVRAGVTPKVKADKPLGQWNRFEITMKGDRLTVVLNGQTVIENAQLPGVSKRGKLALQHHGDPVEFANIYIKELD